MISRRSFVQGGALAAVAAASGWRQLEAFAEQPAQEPTSAISGVYARSLVIDTLCPDGPFFDPQAAVDAGLTAAVVDIPSYPATSRAPSKGSPTGTTRCAGRTRSSSRS